MAAQRWTLVCGYIMSIYYNEIRVLDPAGEPIQLTFGDTVEIVPDVFVAKRAIEAAIANNPNDSAETIAYAIRDAVERCTDTTPTDDSEAENSYYWPA